MEEKFKKGEIVYVAKKDINNEYHPKMYKIIDVEVEPAINQYIYTLAPEFNTSNTLIVRPESAVFKSSAGARIHCNILNYGGKYENRT